jgi:hypothetical protein
MSISNKKLIFLNGNELNLLLVEIYSVKNFKEISSFRDCF